MAKKSAEIIEIKGVMGETGFIIIEWVGIDPLRELREEMEGMKDKRLEPFVEHLLPDIVMITLPAVMARANEWSEIAEFGRIKAAWLGRFLVVPHGIPWGRRLLRNLGMRPRRAGR